MLNTELPSFARQVNSAESPLRHPRRFWREALRDLRSAREPAARLYRQSIAQRYRHSLLGIFWAFAPSILTAAMMTLGQRSHVPGLKASGVPPQVYAVFGLVMAQTFLETLSTQRALFTTHRHLLSRHRTPIEGMMLAGLGENLFGLAIKMGVLAVVFLVFKITPAQTLPFGLAGMCGIFLLGSGVGLLLAPWNALSKDLDNAMGFFPWIFFMLTPIFVSLQPGSTLYKICRWNPLTWFFNATRAFTYGSATLRGDGLPLLSLWGCILLLPVAWLLCRLARPYVIERFLG